MRARKQMSIESHSEAGKARMLVAGAILAVACLLSLPSLASADYEQVPEHFGEGAEVTLQNPYGMAVNSSGAGGVEAGSIYVSSARGWVQRFSPGHEGEAPRFREAWGWGIAEGGPQAYVRCGPAWAETPEGSRPTNAFANCNFQRTLTFGEQTGHFGSLIGVAVNPANGYVYVYNQAHIQPPELKEHHLIEVFTPTGTPVGEGFGERGRRSPAPAESIAEGPEKLHEQVLSLAEGSIAVDEAGTVYVTDTDYTATGAAAVSRAMSFKPESPGNYEHYVYAGQNKDIISDGSWFRRLALVGPNRLVGLNKENQVKEYATGGGSTAICSRELTGGEAQAMAANPLTGEIFVLVAGIHLKLIRLGACNEGTGQFEELQEAVRPTPEVGSSLPSLTINPTLSWGSGRPSGVVYGAAEGVGYVFAQAEEHRPPDVESETVTATNSNSTTLRALIDAHHQTTRYTFQYLTADHYQANEPDERQSLTVSATGGLFGLAFQGARAGGEALVDLADGSTQATNLRTATATAKLSAATGKGNLVAGEAKVTGLVTEEGAFKAGQRISGAGIPSGTTIVSATASGLTLSKAVTSSGTAISLQAGSTTLTSVVAGIGQLEAGRPIRGEGIPADTTIVEVKAGEVVISNAATKAGTGVAISDPGPYPLAVGEAIEGPGIVPGTTIVAAKAGELTLSQSAEASQAGASVRAGLPFDAAAAEIRKALEGLNSIGAGNVEVAGGPGDESGSSPYEVTFTGALTNHDLPELEADATGLSGGSASATVATVHDGGGGFAGAAEVPASPATLDPSGIATAPLTGLAPETAYRFRVVAESNCDGSEAPPCVAIGETAAFSTYPVAPPGLPDSRAYELVSPAQKQGGEVFPADGQIGSCLAGCKPPGVVTNSVFPMQSAPDGDSVSYMGFPFSPEVGAAAFNSYISRRTESGWQTTTMSPRTLGNQSFVAYSEGLDRGSFTQSGAPLTEGAQPGTENIYLQDGANPAALEPVITEALYEALAPSGRPYREFVRIDYAGHSDDFAAQYFSASDSLTFATPYAPQPPEIFSFERNLYESRGGQLSLVNVLPGNTEVAKGATFVSTNPQTNGIAAGGRRVFWQAGGHLYMREDNRTTREVHHAASFLTASPDGLEVLLSDGCLYSLQTTECAADLSDGEGGFLGIAGQNPDLSRIYFVDKAALAPGAEAGVCDGGGSGHNSQEIQEEAEGKVPPGHGCNLYLYEAGASTQFIATLSRSDGPGIGSGENRGIWAAKPGARTAEASPDGRYLAFQSGSRLTGYDNRGLCAQDPNHTEYVSTLCREVFLYDSAADRLTCPSCNPSGEAPAGHSHLRLLNGGASRDWLPQPRYLTNRGRLFFDSGDRLSERDTNGRVEDVYEFEPQGVGSCAKPNGCVRLISPGSGGVDSNFLTMGGEGGEEGSNVFFTSREQLVAKDTDELLDVYDARVDGGFSAETETTRSECQGESCQPTPSPPQETTPSSSTFHGAGNVVEGGKASSRCPKGKHRVKRGGKSRCVAKHKKRHRGHRKHRRANADRRAHR